MATRLFFVERLHSGQAEIAGAGPVAVRRARRRYNQTMMDVSRREFLGAAGAAVLTAKSYAQVKNAAGRLRIGVIGCGGMANSHMRALVKMREAENLDIVAVCDLYDKRAEEASQLTGGKIYKNYHQLLANKDIDYVLIATPEHWHFQMAMDALDSGKHVYVEKPMTHAIEESKKLVARVKKTGLKLQVGVQGMSDESYQEANKYVKDGALGKIVLAQIDYSRNHTADMWDYAIDPDAKPGVNLDWITWQGKTKKRQWDPYRYFRWRLYWDYSGGIASDLYIHRVTRIIKACGLTFPEYVAATGGRFQFTDGKGEVPDTFNVLLDYPGGPTVQLISSMANDTAVQHLMRGHKATLEFTRTGFEIRPQRDFAKEAKPATFKKKGAEDVSLHHKNLQAAIRRNAPLNCDSMLGYYGVVACDMAVDSFRRRKYLRWDKAKERAVGA